MDSAKTKDPENPEDLSEEEVKRLLTAVEEELLKDDDEVVEADPGEAFVARSETDAPVPKVVKVPTGEVDALGRKRVVLVAIIDPGVSSEAVAVKLNEGGDARTKDQATLRLWQQCVAEGPPGILRAHSLGEDFEDAEVRKWKTEHAAWVKAGSKDQPPRRPLCFEDTTSAFRAYLTQHLMFMLGIDADFMERLLRGRVSKRVLQQAVKSFMKSRSATASTRRKSKPTAAETPDGSSTPTSTPKSETPGSASNGTPTPSTPAPSPSAPRTSSTPTPG